VLIGPEQRGGKPFDASTFQWTEVLDRTRGDQLDLGRWGVWGVERYRYALLARTFGRKVRHPRKRDFEYNMAISNARCSELTTGPYRQLPGLLKIIAADPVRWARGLVVIRIGINSLSGAEELDEYARTGLTPEVEQRLDGCVDFIEEAIRALRSEQAGIRVALVGIAEDINGPGQRDRWRSAGEVPNIRRVLDHFDSRLTRIADADPSIAFVEDRRWWQHHFGGRDEDGTPRLRALNLGGERSVTNSLGNHPSNAVLEDGHAGTVVNGLWTNHLIQRLNDEFGLGVRPLLDAEIADLADPDGSYGVSPPRETKP